MNKKNLWIAGIIAFAAISLLVLAGFLLLAQGNEKKPVISEASSTVTQSATTTATTEPPTTTSPPQRFIIGAWKGKLAVYDAATPDTPFRVYDVYISSLPESEQQRLNKGILVSDKDMLNKLLEDYTS